MTGAAVRLNLAADPRVARYLDRLAQFDLEPLLEGLGAEVESQTRRRIQNDKASPSGEPWEGWSDAYDETRHSGQSLLQSMGPLLNSISYQVQGDSVLVGSPLIYAATHNFGNPDRGIPQREFLGVEGQDFEDLVGITEDYLEAMTNG
ncbi:phage virion morphogenesis protein [Pseudomonas solani]|uniref:phage virion morphogenesis protein n=1 Tax=Pseudomonas solani TaxID=2731552 RepID=UPI0035BE1B5F